MKTLRSYAQPLKSIRNIARQIGRAQSELQSQSNLVCRLLLEKKKKKKIKYVDRRKNFTCMLRIDSYILLSMRSVLTVMSVVEIPRVIDNWFMDISLVFMRAL